MHYHNFDLTMWPADRAAHRYFVSGAGTDGSSGQAEVDLAPVWADLQDRARRLAAGVHQQSRYSERRTFMPTPFEEVRLDRDAMAFGRMLFEQVFVDEVEHARRSARRSAKEADAGLRLRLRLQATPELAVLPWEFLYDDDFLATSYATPTVRCVDRSQPLEPMRIDGALNVLVVAASPKDLPGLDVDREIAGVQRALAQPIADNQISVRVVEDGTWASLVEELRPGPYRQKYHVLHFIGHGGVVDERPMLAFEDSEGLAAHQHADALTTILKNHPSLALIVLNACHGATATTADAGSSLAAALLRRAVPAVAAMQFAISDRAAISFSEAFYRALADSNPIDTALSLARANIAGALSVDGPSLEWATPVLYLRATSGALFDVVRA